MQFLDCFLQTDIGFPILFVQVSMCVIVESILMAWVDISQRYVFLVIDHNFSLKLYFDL